MKSTPLVILHPHFTLPGGAGKVMLEIGKRLAKERVVIIIAQTIWPRYYQEYPEIKFVSLNGPTTGALSYWLLLPWWMLSTVRILEQLRRKYGNIAVLSNVFPAQWTGLLYARIRPKLRSIWFCQEPSAFIHNKRWRRSIRQPLLKIGAELFQPVLSLIDRKLARYANTICANSNFSATEIYNVYHRNSTVIYPGTNLTNKNAPKWGERLDVILAVGRLTKFKRFDLIIEGFHQAKLANYKLIIVGDGEEREALQLLINNLKLEQQVEIRPTVNDEELAALYNTSKILTMASKNEPFGMVAIEAMAAGMVVIADRSGGPMEIVEDGKTGRLIEDLSSRNLASTLQSLIQDKEMLIRMSSAAQTRAAHQFTWDAAASALSGLL